MTEKLSGKLYPTITTNQRSTKINSEKKYYYWDSSSSSNSWIIFHSDYPGKEYTCCKNCILRSTAKKNELAAVMIL